MTGLAGNDTYAVDNAGDVVIESFGEGTDTVQSGITYTLGSDVENLTLTGSADINGTGNALDNVIIGNSGANTMTGLAGNDTYVVDNAGDVVIENANEGMYRLPVCRTEGRPRKLNILSGEKASISGGTLSQIILALVPSPPK